MINIIIRRSDPHLRVVLATDENIYKRNFARAMVAKSQNAVVCYAFNPSGLLKSSMVGNFQDEILAYILNGVSNRPLHDALLLY